jgi:DNA-binding NtrC family response regulator
MKSGARRILLVENDQGFRKSLANCIKSAGYDVVAVGNGMAATNSLQRDKKVKAVVTDRRLPLMGGEELTRWVKKNRPGVSVILFIDDELLLRFSGVVHATGADEVVGKGEIIQKLPAMLDSLIGPARPFG